MLQANEVSKEKLEKSEEDGKYNKGERVKMYSIHAVNIYNNKLLKLILWKWRWHSCAVAVNEHLEIRWKHLAKTFSHEQNIY